MSESVCLHWREGSAFKHLFRLMLSLHTHPKEKGVKKKSYGLMIICMKMCQHTETKTQTCHP